MACGQPRQVAILIDSLSPGGAERVAIESAAALDRVRYRPHLIVTRQGGPLEGLARERDIPLTILDRRRAIEPQKLARALSIVRESDVVHAHLWGSGMWGALLARVGRRPLIAHVHRYDAGRSRGWFAGYRYWITPTAHTVACVSEEISEAFLAAGLPAAKLAYVPNGVVLGEAISRDHARLELDLPSDRSVIGMVARLREEKGHDLALESLARLHELGHDVILCVVGDGPEEERLRALAVGLGVDKDVRWAGPRENAGRLMRAFDVALITSTAEGMPLAALEALVEGVPLVSTDVGAMPDLLADGGGTIVASASPDGIAEALARALSTCRTRPMRSSMERARDRFGIDRVARQLEQIYDASIAAF